MRATDPSNAQLRSTRIALVTSYPFPAATATANRVKALAEGLASDPSFRVAVIGPGPDATTGDETATTKPYDLIVEKERSYARANLFLRAYREVVQTLRLLRAARHLSPEVVVVTVPSIFLLAAVWSFPRGRVAVDLRDLAWEYLAAGTGLKRHVGRLLTRLATLSLRRAALVSVTNDAARLRLEEREVPSVHIIRNGISAERFNKMLALCERDPPPGPTRVTYVGNVGLAQELDTLILALGGEPGIEVVIVGGGSDLQRLQQLVERQRFANVVLTGPKPWDEVLRHYAAAHVLYGQIGEAYSTAVPSKLFEYLVTGRRVVFGTPVGIARTILGEFAGVQVVDPRDHESLRKSVRAIVDRGEYAPLTGNRERVRNEYLREPQAKEFVRLVKQLQLVRGHHG